MYSKYLCPEPKMSFLGCLLPIQYQVEKWEETYTNGKPEDKSRFPGHVK